MHGSTDRYREAIWNGVEVQLSGAKIKRVEPFGGLSYVPEDVVDKISDTEVSFQTRTSGDYDGVVIWLEE